MAVTTTSGESHGVTREILIELVQAGVFAALLLELAAEAGQIAPRIALTLPDRSAAPLVDLGAFTSLSGGPGWHAGGALEAWAKSDENPEGTYFATPLLVAPSLAPIDTLLVVAARRDVRLEAALCERRRSLLGALLLTAVEQAADAIEVTDRGARVVYVNRAWQRIFGYSSAEAIGRYASELVRDRARPAHDASFYRFTEARVTAGQPWLGVLASSTRAGTPHLNEVTVSPFALEAAAFRGNFVVRRDVAHRAERDSALLHAHTEFRGVLAAIPDGVVVLRDGLVYYANPAFLTLATRDDQSLVGYPLSDLLADEDRASFERRDATAPVVVRMHSATGGARLVELSAAGSISFEGRPATILIARDITERRLSEEQLSRAERLAALGELAAGVAHELNNPMAYVLTNLELLSSEIERRAEPSLREPLSDALDGVRRMREIATELRRFGRADDAGEPEAVDVKRAVTSALSIAQNQIRHRAQVERELEADLWVMGREGQLVQVLVNLLLNAAQAIPEGDTDRQRIAIRARALPHGRVEISVSDTGPGFPEEIWPQLFRPFTTSRLGQGLGLGLAISRRIVARFGGEISARNLEPHGAIVSIVLPSAGLPPPTVATVTPLVPAPGRTVRVLIIDDEPAIGRALRRVLAAHEVMVATDGNEAIALLSARRFDVVLCDLMMPGISGARLFELVCERWPELASRFVFITGGALTDDASRFLETTERTILAKPFSNTAVLEVVEQVMSAHEASTVPPLEA
jgi:PAS domain S-box-containing protein